MSLLKQARLSAMRYLNLSLIALVVALVVVGIATSSLRLWESDVQVPFHYKGDTLWFLVPIKGIVDNGWSYEIPQLSAPFGLSAIAFPSATNVDWALLKLIGIFAPTVGSAVNVFWLLTMVLTAWTATVAFAVLGIDRKLAISVGILYAFLPYVFVRNITHINLVYYFVPFLSLFAIYLATGCRIANERLILSLGLVGAIGQGFSYIYFSFFSLLILFVALVVGSVTTRSMRCVTRGIPIMLVLLLSASLNLLPSLISWYSDGKPPGMDYKQVSESEIYGLKIRKLLVPHELNGVPGLSHWARSDYTSGFPFENENVAARLGIYSAVGFVLLLMVSVRIIQSWPGQHWVTIQSAAALSLFCLLVGTIGGLGAVLSQVVPDFRAYNRISVFIAFFSLAGLTLMIQSVIARARRFTKVLLIASLVVVLLLSLYDQLLGVAPLVEGKRAEEAQAAHERLVVSHLEELAPEGALVYQLPETGFPVDHGRNRMSNYDHARPFFWSSVLSWSWPDFSQRSRSWSDFLNGLEGEQFAKALVLSGFRFLWVDRYGYEDGASSLVEGMLALGAIDALPGISDRYLVLDFKPLGGKLGAALPPEEIQHMKHELLNIPDLQWLDGVYSLEENPEGRKFRWSRARSEMSIRYDGDQSWEGVLEFALGSGKPGMVHIEYDGEKQSVSTTSTPTQVLLPIRLGSHAEVFVKLTGDMGRIDLPTGETRDLHFFIMDMRFDPWGKLD